MANEIVKALEKVNKLKERHAKMVGIFEKSETKRTATIAKLTMMIANCEKKAGEIEAKKTKVLEDLAAQIAVAEQEEVALKAALAQAVEKAAQPTPEVQD